MAIDPAEDWFSPRAEGSPRDELRYPAFPFSHRPGIAMDPDYLKQMGRR